MFDGAEKVGVLVFQMPIDRINALMGSDIGLGVTGEAIIVGSDHYMRNDPRFATEPVILKGTLENAAVDAALAALSTTLDAPVPAAASGPIQYVSGIAVTSRYFSAEWID